MHFRLFLFWTYWAPALHEIARRAMNGSACSEANSEWSMACHFLLVDSPPKTSPQGS